MAVFSSDKILRKNAYEALKDARETGESVILMREGKPEVIMLTFDDYIRMRTGESQDDSHVHIRQLEQVAVDSTVCMRNCPFRRPKPGSIQRLRQRVNNK